jgi:hypothetical protein
MTARAAERGQPLVTLGVLLGGWIVLRTALWQSPFPDLAPLAAQPAKDAPVFASLQGVEVGPSAAPVAGTPAATIAWTSTGLVAPPLLAAIAAAAPDETASLPAVAPAEPQPPAPMPLRSAAGHSLMLMAGFANLELPPELARYLAPRLQRAPAAVPFHPATAMRAPADGDRWSADAWLLLRKDTTTAVTSGRGSYGQSQLGAVLRFRLAPSSPHRPTAYLRASQALAGAQESEAALGLAARPVPRVPVAVAGELRLTRTDGGTLARPAAYAVTELPPLQLPEGFAAEAYMQAGYVGGRFATGFVDGQVRAERKLADLGKAELRAGGGVWGGAQQGASRLDVGPSATVKLTIGATPARASMDWRFRVAGTAEPRSGPALTISAGF